MKVAVNIEIFDNSSESVLEEFGITSKFLKMGYEQVFKNQLNEICKGEADYTLSVEVTDNTVS